MRYRTTLYRIISVTFGVLVAVVFCEVALRTCRVLVPGRCFVWRPNTTTVFTPDPVAVPGVHGPSRVTVNALGIRGDEVAHQDYKVLAMGGSATECLYLDQAETWPYILQTTLSGKGKRTVWVGNTGRAGLAVQELALQLQHLLPQIPDIDLVIALIGVNALTRPLACHPSSLPTGDARRRGMRALRRAFAVVPRSAEPGCGSTWGSLLSRAARPSTPTGPRQGSTGRWMQRFRADRQSAQEMYDSIPLMHSFLASYARNIHGLIDFAKHSSVRILLVTQPTMWRRDLPPRLESLLWTGGGPGFGWREPDFYYSAGALAEGMDEINRALCRTCRERQVEFLDLAAQVPRDATVFYDDVHFNESGARLVARILAEYLLDRPPWRQ